MGIKAAVMLLCMLGTSGLLSAGCLYAQEDPEAIIEEKCASDWPDNDRMRAACIEQQGKVLDKSLSSPIDSCLPLEDLTFLREKCAKDWPDDFRMRAHCLEEQLAAMRKHHDLNNAIELK